jgi:hypothetical protein
MDTAATGLHTHRMALVCAPTAWSAVSSAEANAALAGVLAGFMLNGIVLLLSRRSSRDQSAGFAQGAALLFMAFITLGLDSFLFGMVTGDGTARACRRAWTEAMYAAGMLGLGAVEVVAGIVFLLGVLLAVSRRTEAISGRDSRADGDYSLTESRDLLADLCNVLKPGVAAVVMFLLWMTTKSYLNAIFMTHVPSWARILVRIEVVFDYVIIGLYLVIHRWWERKILPWLDRKLKETINIRAWRVRLLRGFAQGIFRVLRPIWNVLQPDSSGGIKTLQMLKLAVMSALGYSIIGVVLGSAPVFFSVAAWNSANLVVDVIIGGTVTWVLLITLLPLAALLAPAYGPQYPPLKECVVCKTRLGRATHVMPTWARWHNFPVVGPVTVSARDQPGADGRYLLDEVQDLSVDRRNAVCRSRNCNAKLLRRLDGDVRPVLAPMAASGRWKALDEVSQELIAKWAVKTVLLLELANRQEAAADESAFAWLDAQKPPSHWRVWLGRWDVDGPQTMPRIQEAPAAALLAPDGSSVVGHLTTLTLGRIAFQVFSDHAAKQSGGLAGNIGLPTSLEQALICIWPPPSGAKGAWPPQLSADWKRLVTWDAVL